MDIFDILLDILLKPPQPFIGLFLQLFQHEFRVHVDSWGGHGKERILCKKTMKKSERLLVQTGHNWCDR